MSFPARVKLVEVGPRDGLQNESQPVPTALKVEFIDRLSQCGYSVIEATSFVSPKWVPSLADHTDVMSMIKRAPKVRYPVLVPNMQGMEEAIAAQVDAIAIFTAASETFVKKNMNCTIAESFERYAPVVEAAKLRGFWVRGYVSCVLGCPFEGEITPAAVVSVAKQLYALGCDEISLGDTIGVGTPLKARALFEAIAKHIPLEKCAAHLHNTYGQALANIFALLEMGVSIFDASIGGLGGCPYAPGASGNVATEDVLYMLQEMGIETGINLRRIIETSQFICHALGKAPESNVTRARLNSSKD